MSEHEASYAYWDSIIAQRALQLDSESALEGNTLVSIETTQDFETSFANWISSHFAQFLDALRLLNPDDQELLLSYYLIKKPQHMLGRLCRETQTAISSNIRQAIRALCAAIMFSGKPTQTQIKPLLAKAGADTKYAALLEEYEASRSFSYLAAKHKIPRAPIRREFRNLANELMAECQPRDVQILGSWIDRLIEKASASGTGYSESQMAKIAESFYTDPELLGQFRIRLEDPRATSLFYTRASSE